MWDHQHDYFVVLSDAGKPILCFPSVPEQLLASTCGLIQAIVASSLGDGGLKSLRAGSTRLILQVKSPIVLMAVSRQEIPTACIQHYLDLLYAQLLLVLSSKGLQVLDSRPSFDLRALLGGTERVMHSLVRS